MSNDASGSASSGPSAGGTSAAITAANFPILFTSVHSAQDLITLIQGVTDPNQGNNIILELYSLFVQARQNESVLLATQAVQQSLIDEKDAIQTSLDNALSDAYDVETKLNTEINVLRGLATGGSQSHKSPTHPDPEIYDGAIAKQLQPFLIAMAVKLRANADWFPTEQDKMAYLFSRLSGKARGQVIGGVQDDGTFTYTALIDMVQVLKQSFGALNEQAEASATILSLKQGHKTLADFLPSWLELNKSAKFDDLASIAILKAALHGALIDRLSYTSPALLKSDLDGFVAQVREADTTVRSLDPNYHKKTSATTSSLPPSTITVPLTTTQGGDAMDLSAAVLWTAKDVNRRPKTDQERAARRVYNLAHGMCTWCNAKDHAGPDCKTSPWGKKKAELEGKA